MNLSNTPAEVVNPKKKRTGVRRKGFPIMLPKPLWHLLMASIGYQLRKGWHANPPVSRKSLKEAQKFFEGHLGGVEMLVGGNKTIRVRSQMVTTSVQALRFAQCLHQGNGAKGTTYLTSTGRRFEYQAIQLEKLSAIELLADAGRQ